ncbi:hypothetical protein BDW59DRAFT_161709 [Aspergillus cavernicola]|uniref:Uncharacterized protein n=1 Tax=Aspergillus cavernicola TaxID=176166 RepID=A0ABR4ICX9_9EURO
MNIAITLGILAAIAAAAPIRCLDWWHLDAWMPGNPFYEDKDENSPRTLILSADSFHDHITEKFICNTTSHPFPVQAPTSIFTPAQPSLLCCIPEVQEHPGQMHTKRPPLAILLLQAAHWVVGDINPDLESSSSARRETRLDAIELFVLLDLLGAKDPTIPSYYPVTHREYQRLVGLEERLKEMGRFYSDADAESASAGQWFIDRDRDVRNLTRATVQDDQVPFSAVRVEVLHVIDVR